MDPFETPAQALALAGLRRLSLSCRRRVQRNALVGALVARPGREMKRRKSPARRAALGLPRDASARRGPHQHLLDAHRAFAPGNAGRSDRGVAARVRHASARRDRPHPGALHGIAESALATIPPVQAAEGRDLAAGDGRDPRVQRGADGRAQHPLGHQIELSERSTRDHRRRRRLARRHVLSHAAASPRVPVARSPDPVLEQPRQARGARGGLPRRDRRDRRHHRLGQRGRAEDHRRDGDALSGRRTGRRRRRTRRRPQSRHDHQPHARGPVRARLRLRARGAIRVSDGGLLPGRALGVSTVDHPAAPRRVDAPDVSRPSGGPRRGSGADEHRAAPGLRHGLPAHGGHAHAGADDVPPAVAHVPAVGPQLHRRGVQLREVHVHAVPDEEPRHAGGLVRRLEPAPRSVLLGPRRASLHVR